MKRKIRWEDYCYIARQADIPWYQKIYCYFTLIKREEHGGGYCVQVSIYWFWYLLLWLPLQLINIFHCMWSEGLRYLDCQMPRTNNSQIFFICDECYADSTYNRMDKIWKSYNTYDC